MLALERQIVDRFPQWFTGPHARITQPLIRGFARLSRLDRASEFLSENAHLAGFALIEAALARLDVRYTVDQVERERIPQSGRVLVVANHPCGAIDALALLHLIGSIRRDVKIVANDFLGAIDGMRDLLLPLRILGGRPSPESVQAIENALALEQCVVVFPAGEVSRLGWRGITDTRWRRGIVRFARGTDTRVLPVKIRARNSAFFYGVSTLYKPLGTALLPREALARKAARIELRVGLPMTVPATGTQDSALASIRQALYAIGTRKETAPASAEPLVHSVERAALVGELQKLSLLGQTPDGKRIYAGRLASDSPLLREIGRLRELSFRAVGEGTNKRLDVDAFDTWYEHIVLWDHDALEIAGAYRVARGQEVFAERGLDGFYTASLFRYGCDALPRLAEGMELGRSFVAPKYWGSRSLDYLWLGIGAYLRQHPQIRYLFGPVSISAALPIAAREQLVDYYHRYFGTSTSAVVAHQPFRFLSASRYFGELDADASFRVLKANLEALGARVPTLYKQYTELCEPGGARFLAFGVDPKFNNAVDGLIEVDLARIRPKKRERYLGVASRPLSEDKPIAA